MNKSLYFQILLVISGLLLSARGADEEKPVIGLDPELSSLNKTCQVLVDNPRAKEALQELLAYAKNTNGIDRMRSRAMAAYALSGLINGSTNLYVRARQSHARAYPDDRHLLRVNPSDCIVTCSTCSGEGFVNGPCPACRGNNTCKACNGKGVRLQYQGLKGTKGSKGLKCSVCGGKGRVICSRCNGTKQLAGRCPDCKGHPLSFKVPPKVYEEFGLIVKGMTKWIENEEVFYQHYASAKSESDPAKRIAALKSLASSYSYRDEKAEIEQLLVADQSAVKKSVAVSKEQEAKDKRELLVLRSLKDAGDPVAGIRTLNEYLEEHPDTEHRLELQSILNQLTAEREKKGKKRRYLFLLSGLVVVLFGISCLKLRQ